MKSPISVAPKTLGIIVLLMTSLGLLLSLSASVLLPEGYRTPLYTATHFVNMLGDTIALVGSILLLRKRNRGLLLIKLGSILFGIAGVGFLFESLIGGIVTIGFAAVYFFLAKNCRLEASSS